MATRSRRRTLLLRAALVAAVVLFLLVVVPLAIVSYPDPLFPHQVRVGSLSLRSDAPIGDDVIVALTSVQARLGYLEINDETLEHRLFLCTRAERYSFFARLLGVSPSSQGVNAPLAHTIFLSGPFLSSMRQRYGARYRYSLLEGDLTHIATHEIAHTLVIHRLGMVRARRLPLWKREGYAEYAAVAAQLAIDVDDDLTARFERYQAVRSEGVGPIREEYVRGQLLVEYLLSIEGLTFDQLMGSEIDADEVFARLESWVSEQA